MYIDITDDNMMMCLSSEYSLELDIVTNKLTRDAPDGWMVRKRFGDHINTERKFINNLNCVPIGLWLELIKICKESNIAMNMSQRMIDYINEFVFDFSEYKAYITDMFDNATNDDGDPFFPYEYQIEGSYNMLKYKRCIGELCTSAGKTLISYMIFKYLYQVKKLKRILYIVPSVDLARQSIDGYETYESFLSEEKCDHTWESGILYSKMKQSERKKISTCNILFGTYQSLNKKNSDFFKDFDACIIDEAHHTAAKSIRDIIIKSCNIKYCIGMTGTFPKQEELDYLTIQSFVGPVVYRYTTNELINSEKRGTPIYINPQIIDWATDEEKKTLYYSRLNKSSEDPQSGARCLKEEQIFVNNSYTRLKYICDIAIKCKKNVLVLFGDIKGGYGKRIYNYIKDFSEKTVFYCDGNTDTKMRDAMKSEMEADLSGQTVMVASIGTMGEGIDMKNLWCILLVNTAKSERLVRQIIGRGLRLFKGKNKVVMIDFVDDLRYFGESKKCIDNYMWKHYKKRRTIYDEQKFPVAETKVSFSKSLSNELL